MFFFFFLVCWLVVYIYMYVKCRKKIYIMFKKTRAPFYFSRVVFERLAFVCELFWPISYRCWGCCWWLKNNFPAHQKKNHCSHFHFLVYLITVSASPRPPASFFICFVFVILSTGISVYVCLCEYMYVGGKLFHFSSFFFLTWLFHMGLSNICWRLLCSVVIIVVLVVALIYISGIKRV